jgi:hypothetical protein
LKPFCFVFQSVSILIAVNMNCELGDSAGPAHVGPDHLRLAGAGGKLEISFHRTVRVSDNKGASDMPPDMGTFPIFPVSTFKKLPERMSRKGGLLVPMYRESQFTRISTVIRNSVVVLK